MISAICSFDFNLNSNPECHILLKVCLTFKKAAKQHFFSSNVLFIILTILCTCSLNSYVIFTKPELVSGKILSSSSNSFRAFKRNFSKSFDAGGSRMICLYEDTFPSGFPGLGI